MGGPLLKELRRHVWCRACPLHGPRAEFAASGGDFNALPHISSFEVVNTSTVTLQCAFRVEMHRLQVGWFVF